MKFIISVQAPNTCQAKQKAKRKLAQWSQENEPVFIQNIRVSNAQGKKIVTIITSNGEETIYL